MKRFISCIIGFLVALFISFSIQPRIASAYTGAGKRVKIYNQASKDYSISNYWKLYLKYYDKKQKKDITVEKSLQNIGCGIFSYVHAIQWITGNRDNNKSKDRAGEETLWKFKNFNKYPSNIGHETYLTFVKNNWSIEGQDGGRPTIGSRESLMNLMGTDNRWVFIINTSGHYACAVDYVMCNSELEIMPDDGKKVQSGCDIYIQIIDSLARASWQEYSGAARKFYGAKWYSMDSSGNKLVERNGNPGEKGAEYFVRYDTFQKVLEKAPFARLRGKGSGTWPGHKPTKPEGVEDYTDISRTNYLMSINGGMYNEPTLDNSKLFKTQNKDYGFIAVATCKKDGHKWFVTENGKYIRDDYVDISSEKVLQTLDNGNLVANIRIKVEQTKYDKVWMKEKPYAAAADMVPVKKGDVLQVVAVYLNNVSPQHYWLQFDNGYFLCANNVKLVSYNNEPYSLTNYDGPTEGKNYDANGSSIHLAGVVSGSNTITRYVAGWYYDDSEQKPAVNEVKSNVNDTSFNIESKINKELKGKELFSVGGGKGNYIYRILAYYYYYQDVTRDDVNPLVESNSPAVIKEIHFTVGGGSAKQPEAIKVSQVNLDISSLSLNKGEIKSVKATVSPDNATTKTLTWKSDNENVAKVSDGKITAVGKGTATITVSAQDGSGKKATCTVTVKQPVTEIKVAPASLIMYVGNSAQQLTATVNPSNADNKNVTWSSSNASVASVDSTGKVTAKAAGIATITAKAADGSGKQGTCKVEVRKYVTAILVSGNATIDENKTITLSASVSPSDAYNKKITWTSSDTSVATVDSAGKVTGNKAGTAMIKATAQDGSQVFGSKTITVLAKVSGITISGNSHELFIGGTMQLSTAVLPANASNKTVAWKSSDTGIAIVSSSGLVTPKAVGTVSIVATATDGSGISSSAYSINVKSYVTGVTVTGAGGLVPGTSLTLGTNIVPSNAANKNVTWASSNTNVATVDQQGKVTAVAKGTATITATASDRGTVKGTCSITVTPPVQNISWTIGSTVFEGDTINITPQITPSDAGYQVKYQCSNGCYVGALQSNGTVQSKTVTYTGTSAGMKGILPSKKVLVEIWVYDNAGREFSYQQTTVRVIRPVQAIVVSGESSVGINGTITLAATITPTDATRQILSWSSSDSSIAAVNSTGIVTGKKSGTTRITAAATDGSGVCSNEFTVEVVRKMAVAITGDSTVYIGNPVQLSATVSSDEPISDYGVNWSSSNTAIATVNENGVVTGVKNGTVVITATSKEDANCKATVAVDVKTGITSVAISGDREIDVGKEKLISSTVLPATASNKQLSWQSSNDKVLSVNDSGEMLGVSAGTATITASATDGSGKSASFTVDVFPAVNNIKLSGATELHPGDAPQWSAAVYPSEVRDKSVTWTSSDSAVATVDNNGKVTAVANGTAIITAISNSYSDISASKPVTVTTLVNGVALSGESAIDETQTVQLTAVVSPSTASNKTLRWSSSNPDAASVSNLGQVTGISEGTTVITAQATDGSGIQKTFEIAVYPLPKTVTLYGSDALLVGETMQMTATVLPENARNRNVLWTSSDTTVATVSNSGLVTAVANGTAVITGMSISNNAISETHQITVTTLVSSIDLTAPERINVGETDTVEALVLPATASNKALEWSSGDEELAVVDTSGNVTGLAPGSVTISASAVDGSEVHAEVEIEIFQPIQSISVDVEPLAYIGKPVVPKVIICPEDASEPYVEYSINNSEVAELYTETETNGPYSVLGFNTPGIVMLTATALDGSDVSGYAHIIVLPYTELRNNTADYSVYSGGQSGGVIGTVALSSDCAYRAAEDKYGAVWNIEHISGDYAVAVGINECTSSYCGFTLASYVDLNLLRINRTGTDIYRVSCTINGQTDFCDVTVHAIQPTVPLPDSVSLSTSTFNAQVGETINIDVSSPVLLPSGSALPVETNTFLYGQGTFNKYAQVTMDDDIFTARFSKAGIYSAHVRYSGANYEYNAEVRFVITTAEGTVPPEVEDITILNPVKYMLTGETSRFDARIVPSAADDADLLWSSSNPDVVSVSTDGTLTALQNGTSVITVSSDNDISATGFVVVTESLLSIDWNDEEVIEVYVGGSARTVIQRVYLTPRASAQLSEAPSWSLKRMEGNNLTLTCEPITGKDSSGQDLYGCAIILKSVSAVGQTDYELTCSDGLYSTSARIKVNANEVESKLPSMVSWSNTTFTGQADELISIHPVIQCWPDGTTLPDIAIISIDGDQYWKNALNLQDYSVSRNAMTFSFSEPGIYMANCVYSCSNMRYLVPVTVRIADSNGVVPVRATDLTLSESEISVEAGNTIQLKAVVAPEDATNKAVEWSVEDPSVATVDTNGLITGVANGRTNIWCTPADTNCAAVKCVVVVENEFTVIQTEEMNAQYLQGEVGNAVAGFRLSTGTANRVQEAGLEPVWSYSRVSGNASKVELIEKNGIRYLVAKELLRGGTDTFEINCTAGTYTWTGQATLTVSDLGSSVPTSVSISQTNYTASVGEEIELDFTPVCSPSGSYIPTGVRANYIGIGQFYNGLAPSYKAQILTTKKDKVKVAFRKSGTYLLSRYYRDRNLTFTTECTINVGTESFNLIKCNDREATVYIGGKPGIAATCVIADTSIEELYGDELEWTAERVSGDCLQVALRVDQSSASLYVAGVKDEGEEVWRISCSFKGITDYVDITLLAVKPAVELPESVMLRQTEFSGMIGNVVVVPLAVQCEPEGANLPSIEDEAWSFTADGNTEYNASWTIADNRMSIRFRESGYYGGRLVYDAGNVSYSFPISFAITDEESVLQSPVQMDVTLSDEIMTVYPEGETDVPVVNAVLSDSLDAYSLASIAAYAQSKEAVWSLEILSGTACDLSVRKVSAASVQIVLGEIAGTGDVNYRVTCTVESKQYSAEGTIHVATEAEVRPQPELKQTYFLTSIGTMITIDASFYDKTSNLKLCAGRDSVWDNADAMASMGYDYQKSGDLLMPVFNQTGSYLTTITNRLSNLLFSEEIWIVVHNAKPIPENATRLLMPKALQEIDEEAFAGVSTNIIDLRGSSIRVIGSRAFADITGLLRVYIPSGVQTISADAFEGCTDIEICCVQGSSADTWAQHAGFAVNYHMD